MIARNMAATLCVMRLTFSARGTPPVGGPALDTNLLPAQRHRQATVGQGAQRGDAAVEAPSLENGGISAFPLCIGWRE